MHRSEYESFISNPVWKEIVSVLDEVKQGLRDDFVELDPLENSTALARQQGRYKMAEFVLSLPSDILREIEEHAEEERKVGKEIMTEEVKNEDLMKEIDSIIADIAPPAPAVEQPTEGEVKEDAAKGEERKEEKAGEQESAESKPAEEEHKEEVAAPVVETPAVEKPVEQESEIDRLKKENEDFRRSLSDMAERLTTPPPQKAKTPEEVAAETEARKRQPPQVYKFIPSEEAFDEVMKSADSFNAFLTNFFNATVQHTLRVVPQVATQMVDSQINLRTTANEFYQANPDLVPHKKYVGFVSNELASQHADWDLAMLLKETEKEVRARLKLAPGIGGAPGLQNENRGSRTVAENPGFVPGGGGGRRGSGSTERVTGQERDIIDLIS